MSTSNTAKGSKPSNPRRPSVRFAETAQTIFSVRDDNDDDNDNIQPEENDEADLGGGGGERRGGRNEAAVGSSQGPHAIRSGAMTANNHSHSQHIVKNSSSPSSSSSSPPSKFRSSYGLKSTQSSREAEFEADDSDVELDDSTGNSSEVMQRTKRSTSLSLPLIDRIPGLPMAVDRARRSISEGANHNLRESLRNAMESEELPDWLRRGAGILDSTWNMSNSILGAGVVGLPYSLKASGCLTGLALLIGIALLTDWTIRLIVLNAKLSGQLTYIDIMNHCFGRNGRAAVSIFQGAFAFGGMCAFIVVIGDTIPHVLVSILPVLEGSFLSSRAFIMISCIMIISYPLSLYRSIESLSRASAIALISMVLIILTVIVRGPAMPAELKGDPSLRFTIIRPSNVVRSIAVISFAFVCHHNSLLIYGSLKEPSMDRFGKVTHYSTAIAAVAAIAMSLAGYWTFTDKTSGNVLNNFPPDDAMVNLARFCFGMNMLTTWPLELFVAREVIETYFFQGEFDQNRHLIFTSALTVASLVVSLAANDLGVVLEVTGGLSATALAFIFPSICYLKLCNEAAGHAAAATLENGHEYREVDDDEEEESALHREVNGSTEIHAEDVELPLRPGAGLRRKGANFGKATPWWLTTKPLAVACAVFGCIVLVISVGTTISDAFYGQAVEPEVTNGKIL